jgi:uncharacterized protein YebE (UPF0316 family)
VGVSVVKIKYFNYWKKFFLLAKKKNIKGNFYARNIRKKKIKNNIF